MNVKPIGSYSEQIRHAALFGERTKDNTVFGLKHVEALLVMAFLGFSSDIFDWMDGDRTEQQRMFLLIVAEELA